MTFEYWTTRELSILREQYPVGGYKACKERLPLRTESSIRQQAAKQGIKAGATIGATHNQG